MTPPRPLLTQRQNAKRTPIWPVRGTAPALSAVRMRKFVDRRSPVGLSKFARLARLKISPKRSRVFVPADAETVAEPHVDLEEVRAVGPVSASVRCHGDRVLACAAVIARRQRVEEDAVLVRIRVGVLDRDGRSAQRPHDPADRQAARLRDEHGPAQHQVVPAVEIGRPLVQVEPRYRSGTGTGSAECRSRSCCPSSTPGVYDIRAL